MKTERAIELLNRISDSQFDGPHGDERREALEMAVRALFSQQIVNDSQGLVNDCISRKMAIDEVKRLHDVAWANWKETRISANTMIDALKDLPSAQPETHDKRTETHACDLINRQQAIDAVVSAMIDGADAELVEGVMELLPSAQPERDIPVKPIETTDRAWGIPKRQAVCPKCDYYLGHVAFLGDYKGKRVTYCETCGQAIDWEGWNFDE